MIRCSPLLEGTSLGEASSNFGADVVWLAG